MTNLTALELRGRSKVMKTNVIRILESHHIEHTTIEYQFSEEEIDAVSVAHKIGAEAETRVKTKRRKLEICSPRVNAP